jgi:hypothetical protein
MIFPSIEQKKCFGRELTYLEPLKYRKIMYLLVYCHHNQNYEND